MMVDNEKRLQKGYNWLMLRCDPGDAAIKTELPLRYRAEIDGLRAVAILGVVAYHVSPGHLPGGYLGVDVFFVVSGYLITQLLIREMEQTGTISLAEFYERRARRLLPALFATVGSALAAAYWFLPFRNARRELGEQSLAALAFVENLHLLHASAGDPGRFIVRWPLAHLWSLSIEEQFYLVYPILIFAVGRSVSLGNRSAWTRALVVGITAGSFIFAFSIVDSDSASAFYLPLARAWELGIGALTALVTFEAGASRFKFDTAGLRWGIIAIGFTYWWPQAVWASSVIVPVIGTALIIGSAPLAPQSLIARTLAQQPAVAIGRVSYAWYLWHWPILVMARRWRFQSIDLPADVGWALVSLVLAILTTRFVENPVRSRRGHQGRLLFAAVLAFGLLATMALNEIRSDLASAGSKRSRSVAAIAGSARVIIWGDAMADAWSPLLDTLATGLGVRSQPLRRAGCPPLLGLTPGSPGNIDHDCHDANERTAAVIQTLARQGDLRGVVIAARWFRYAPGWALDGSQRRFFDVMDVADPDANSALRTGLERTLQFTDSLGVRVLILLPPPEFEFPPADCLLINPVERCGTNRDRLDATRRSALRAMQQVIRFHRGVRIVDPVSFFCSSTYCPPVSDGIIVTDDVALPSAAAARAFASTASDDMLWLVRGERPRPIMRRERVPGDSQ